MKGSTEGFQEDTGPVIQSEVRELLLEHEQDDSLLTGTILDIATITPDSPYENFEVDLDRLINSSEKLIDSVSQTEKYEDCIAVAVELPNNDIFVDLFTYDSSNMTDYPSIESLAMSLDVDISSVHHVIGKEVDIIQDERRWRICEHKETPPVEPSVTPRDFFNPFAISVLLTPLGVLTGMYSGISVILTTTIGLFGTLLTYGVLLYLTLSGKRDHRLPGFLGQLSTPDYHDGQGSITEGDGIVDVNQGEFQRIITLADEDEYDSPRAVLYNLAVVVTIPPHGEQVVPVPAPATGWRGSVIKQFVYSLSSSVETLDRSHGQLVPLRRDGNRIVIDESRLTVQEPARSRTFTEKTADAYVEYINSFFDTPVRDDIY